MIPVVKIPWFVLVVALGAQGLFFSLYAADNQVVKDIGVFDTMRREQAIHDTEKGLVDLAIPELKKITACHPDDIKAYAYLGYAYSLKGSLPDAVRAFQKVFEINPSLYHGYFDYPLVKDIPPEVKEFTVNFEEVIFSIDEVPCAHEVLGLCYVVQGRLGDALNEYEKVLKQSSKFGKHAPLVYRNERVSPLDQAIQEYEDVLQGNPDYGDAYIKLACAYAEKGALDLAISHMNKAVLLDPERFELHVYLACFFAKKWMMAEALKELDEAGRIRERIVTRLLTDGESYIQNASFDRAISTARDVVKIHHNNKKARQLLAEAYGKSGDVDKAIEACKEIRYWYADDIDTYVLLGWMYAQGDVQEEAMKLAEQAFSKAPGNAESLALMAFLYASHGQVQHAQEVCNSIIHNNQEQDFNTTDYGWVRGKVASFEQKLREVLDVLEMKPDYREGYLCLGWLYSKNGDIEKAIAAFKKATELFPGLYDAHVYLGNIYVQKGKIKDALEEYTMALEITAQQAQVDISRGLEYFIKGDLDSATKCLNGALKTNPENGDAYYALADICEKKGCYEIGMMLRLQGARIKNDVHHD